MILKYAMEQPPVLDGSVTLAWAPGKRHVFLSEGIRQHLEHLRTEIRHKSATLMQATWRGWWWRKKMGNGGAKRSKIPGLQQAPLPNNKTTPNSAAQNKAASSTMAALAAVAAAAPISGEIPPRVYPFSAHLIPKLYDAVPRLSAKTTSLGIGGTVARPRPQPIAGTPPPDPQEKCDQKIIQQTCNLFGLDLVCVFYYYCLLDFIEISNYFYLTGTSAASSAVSFLHDHREFENKLSPKPGHEDELSRGGTVGGAAAEEGRSGDRSGGLHRSGSPDGGAQGAELPRSLPVHDAQ